GPAMTEPHFGTNFLHVTVGVPYAGGAIPREPLATDDRFVAGLAEIARNKEQMAGFAVRMYGTDTLHDHGEEVFPVIPDLPWFPDEPPPITDKIEKVGEPPPANEDHTIYWATNGGLGGPPPDPMATANIAAHHASQLADVADANADVDALNAQVR